MPLFSSQFLTRLRFLALNARRVGGGLAAPSVSQLPAGGTELSGYRDYAAGDDYRQVDWHLSARHDELFTRQFEGETDLRVYLLLDGSRSMAAGRPSKFDAARQVAAALAFLALGRHQRVAVGLQVHVLVGPASPHTATATIAADGELAVGRRTPHFHTG